VSTLAYTLEPAQANGSAAVRVAGRLSFRDAEQLRADLRQRIKAGSGLKVDLSGVEALDGGAAAILAAAWSDAQCNDSQVEFVDAPPAVQAVLDLYTDRAARPCMRPAPGRVSTFEQVGSATVELTRVMSQVVDFVGDAAQAVANAVRNPRSIAWRDVARLIERHGADSLPIVLLVGFLIGLITAFQAATQLHQLGADSFVAQLVGLSLTRELAPLMTAIVIAGRSGAAIAAEMGTMTVSEEIDAIRTLGLCPQRFLVFPRVLALTFVLPILTLLADFVGLAAGLAIATGQLEISMQGYIAQTQEALDLWDVFGGVIKAVVFGFVIALIACERGLATRGGAEGVGRSTTSAVVAILFHLILLDALFTILYQQLGI